MSNEVEIEMAYLSLSSDAWMKIRSRARSFVLFLFLLYIHFASNVSMLFFFQVHCRDIQSQTSEAASVLYGLRIVT
jgi:hypothetical protein